MFSLDPSLELSSRVIGKLNPVQNGDERRSKRGRHPTPIINTGEGSLKHSHLTDVHRRPVTYSFYRSRGPNVFSFQPKVSSFFRDPWVPIWRGPVG